MASTSIIFILSLAIASISAGIVPAAYVANYATSYSAHAVNHALATPVVAAAPLVAAPAPVLAAHPAPVVAAYSAPFVSARVAPIATAAYGFHPY